MHRVEGVSFGGGCWPHHTRSDYMGVTRVKVLWGARA
jgi:hypothetical protein